MALGKLSKLAVKVAAITGDDIYIITGDDIYIYIYIHTYIHTYRHTHIILTTQSRNVAIAFCLPVFVCLSIDASILLSNNLSQTPSLPEAPSKFLPLLQASSLLLTLHSFFRLLIADLSTVYLFARRREQGLNDPEVAGPDLLAPADVGLLVCRLPDPTCGRRPYVGCRVYY